MNNLDIIYNIIYHLDLSDIHNICCVNRDFNIMCHHQHLLIQKFNQLPIIKLPEYTYSNLLSIAKIIHIVKKTIKYMKIMYCSRSLYTIDEKGFINHHSIEWLKLHNLELLLKLNVDNVYIKYLKFIYDNNFYISYLMLFDSPDSIIKERLIVITEDELVTYLTNMYMNNERIVLENTPSDYYIFNNVSELNKFINKKLNL